MIREAKNLQGVIDTLLNIDSLEQLEAVGQELKDFFTEKYFSKQLIGPAYKVIATVYQFKREQLTNLQ